MTKSVAIITGASQGIGRATAVRLARDFAKVVLVARNGANLKETAKQANENNKPVDALKMFLEGGRHEGRNINEESTACALGCCGRGVHAWAGLGSGQHARVPRTQALVKIRVAG